MNVTARIDQLTDGLTIDLPEGSTKNISYLDALKAIQKIGQPLFKAIAGAAEEAGYSDVSLLQAGPKGFAQSIAIASQKDGKVESITLLKNIKRSYALCGGGVTSTGDTLCGSARRYAQDQFNAPEDARHVYLGINSLTHKKIAHAVEGIHLFLISKDQIAQLQFGGDAESHCIETFPVNTFHRAVNGKAKQSKPTADMLMLDAWIQKTLAKDARRWMSAEELSHAPLDYTEYIKKTRVDAVKLSALAERVSASTKDLSFDPVEGERWSDSEQFRSVRDACQRLYDELVKALLPKLKYFNGKKRLSVRQFRVQPAQVIYINGQPLPSFLSISQFTQLQQPVARGTCVRVTGCQLLDQGRVMNLKTEVVMPD